MISGRTSKGQQVLSGENYWPYNVTARGRNCSIQSGLRAAGSRHCGPDAGHLQPHVLPDLQRDAAEVMDGVLRAALRRPATGDT